MLRLHRGEIMAVKMDEAARRRVRAGRLLMKGKRPAEVAAIVGAPRQTVYRWLGVLQERGIDGLREMSKGGRPSRMRAEQLEELHEALLAGPRAAGYGTDLWTPKRVRLLIEKRFGIKYSEVQVWRLLGAMGFSGQKPERRAIERDEEAIALWKKRTWPRLKKKPGGKAASSSSSTSRGCRSVPPGCGPGRPRGRRRSFSSTSTGSSGR
jgi:transposase